MRAHAESLIRFNRKIDRVQREKDGTCFTGKYFVDARDTNAHLWFRGGKREMGEIEEGYPNFLLHLADGCLNPEIAFASFKITHRCTRSYRPGALVFHLACGVGLFSQGKYCPEDAGGHKIQLFRVWIQVRHYIIPEWWRKNESFDSTYVGGQLDFGNRSKMSP